MSRPAQSRAGLATALTIAACFGGAGFANEPLLPSADARAPKQEPLRPAGIPSDEELRAQGARIGSIRFDLRPLFDFSGVDQPAKLSRLGNRLHILTRRRTIEDQLLFGSGDVYDARLIQENARILRDARYLRDAAIVPVAYHDGVVDLEVVTQDVWTLNPGLSFGRKGGENSTGFELEELNFLGRGTQFAIGHTSAVDRDSDSIYYRDPMLGSSWWSLYTNYSDNSDGRLAALSLDHPFYALDVRRAGGVWLRDDRRTDKRYDLGEIIDEYQTREKLATAYFGWSGGRANGHATRWSAGVGYEDRQFDPAPGEAVPRLLPVDRKLVYPWLAVEWLQDDYRTTRNRDQIEKTEDYTLGWRIRVQLGYADEQFGSDRDAVVFNGSVSKGFALTDTQTIGIDAGMDGRMENGSLAGTVLQANARYHRRQSARRLFFVNLSATAGRRLDADRQILLGGDSGLRGYPLRYQAGEGRWLFTAEQRWFSNWFPFQLFNVGGALFYDMGATWGRDALGTPSQGLLKDVGFGLRLGNSRSALGNVVHVDVAVPLDGDASIQDVQLLVETSRTF